MNTLTLLNETGDITIAWNEDQNERMREMIEKKLDKGYAFFIMESKFFGLWKSKQVLKSIKDLSPEQREIILRDEDASDLLCENGDSLLISTSPKGDIDSTKRSTDADEIMNSNSLAIRPIATG